MKNIMQGFMGLTIIVGFFLVLGTLLMGAFKNLDITGSLKDVLLVMLGALGSMAGMVVSFYFGSSKGSAIKDETIKNISEGNVP